MGKLLPTSSDATINREEQPQLLCIDDDLTSEVFKALSSDTSQDIFALLNEEPMAAQDISDELDLSLQRVSYHLDNLQESGLITVLDTCYSEKGMEMDVYGPPETPLLLYLGPSDDRPGMIASFKQFVHALGPIAAPVAIGQALVRLVSGDE
ncbi:ArsR family transcription regulator (plasmid) [Natrialba magadii ATCC 43099]|uniref:ArsR family transcription regulator n=1 Tax=Natrialba magadii (strain ATCC 43099 / DSM 3394 / CCM 3739 / CIP 104546 / IAM 13178 / JCM 8861 / NBRC 102185 / NCIMB 2190 / MS3) TaxID=547559 RepID=D3T1Z1_NATMM|nr:helix-turn-helix domain-containing protein [Natrialba magadii]ADD07600.1 ArsR family transcription regulator [Natrialba magadii ATCC 43099]ELY27075.1 ArsR family transcriptional regulator [Natrialba magadii ATCC 43099]